MVLCRYREGGTLGTALWRYRGSGTSAAPWGWYFGDTVGLVPLEGKAVPWGSYRGRERRYREAGAVQGRRYRGVGTVGRKGGTVGGDVVQVVAVPWGHGTSAVPWGWYRGAVPWEVMLCK